MADSDFIPMCRVDLFGREKMLVQTRAANKIKLPGQSRTWGPGLKEFGVLKSASVTRYDKAADIASITIVEDMNTVDLALAGIDEGLMMKIDMWYDDVGQSLFKVPPPMMGSTVFIGRCGKPKVKCTDSGIVEIDIPARSVAYLMAAGKKSRDFDRIKPRGAPDYTRGTLLLLLLAPYLKDFDSNLNMAVALNDEDPAIGTYELALEDVKTGPNPITDLKQVKESDLAFIKRLLDTWDDTIMTTELNLITGRPVILFSKSKSLDKSSFVRMFQPKIFKYGVEGANVVSIDFEANEQAKDSATSITSEGNPPVYKAAPIQVFNPNGEDDVYVLKDDKVKEWMKNHGGIAKSATLSELKTFLETASSKEVRDTFYEKQVSKSTPVNAERPPFGAAGQKCKFKLKKGMPFLKPGTGAIITGRIPQTWKTKTIAESQPSMKDIFGSASGEEAQEAVTRLRSIGDYEDSRKEEWKKYNLKTVWMINKLVLDWTDAGISTTAEAIR